MDPAIRESLLERLDAYLYELGAAEAPEADVAETATATRTASDGAPRVMRCGRSRASSRTRSTSSAPYSRRYNRATPRLTGS